MAWLKFVWAFRKDGLISNVNLMLIRRLLLLTTVKILRHVQIPHSSILVLLYLNMPLSQTHHVNVLAHLDVARNATPRCLALSQPNFKSPASS